MCVYYCSTYYKGCVFITTVPTINLFAWGEEEGGLFITAVPNTKLCAWGEEDRGEHVL